MRCALKRIAIITWGEIYDNDQLFNSTSVINRDNTLDVWETFRSSLNDKGYEVHTIDVYNSIQDVDFYVFFTFNSYWYKKIKSANLTHKTMYIAFEPEVVDPLHGKSGLKLLSKYFKYILTWDDNYVDNKVCFKMMYPFVFNISMSDISFDKKKLMVNISANKSSSNSKELYSARKKVIEFYDGEEEFELYGPGWEKEGYSSYKGLAKSKTEIYHRFKFALCLENMYGEPGYVTEKILDCIQAGVVPVYYGASDISKYIPEGCYVHFNDFGTIEMLDAFLRGIDELRYNQYLDCIKAFLQSENTELFSPEALGNTIISLMLQEGNDKLLSPPLLYLLAVKKLRYYHSRIRLYHHSITQKSKQRLK